MLFNELGIPEEEFSFGRSKIFIRNPRTVSEKCLLQNQALSPQDSIIHYLLPTDFSTCSALIYCYECSIKKSAF